MIKPCSPIVNNPILPSIRKKAFSTHAYENIFTKEKPKKEEERKFFKCKTHFDVN